MLPSSAPAAFVDADVLQNILHASPAAMFLQLSQF